MKTIKKRKFGNNGVTRKIYKTLIDKKQNKHCNTHIGLKSFEKEYEKKYKNEYLKKSNEQIKKSFVKKLLTRYNKNIIKPNDDFYDYINSVWLKKVNLTEEQKYIVQVDDFRLIQDKVYHELDEIIIDYIKTNNNKLSKNLNYFRNSIISMNSKKDSRIIAYNMIKKIDELRKDKNNLWKMLAMINTDEIIAPSAPFIWSLNADEKDPQNYRCYLSSHHFLLLDLSVYFDDGTNREYKSEYVKNFKGFCKKLFDTVLGHNKIITENIHEVDRKLFNSFICDDVDIKKENEEETYNKVYSDEALEKYGFDWKTFSKELGFHKTPEFFISNNLTYLKCCTKLLKEEWNSELWRPYWIYIYLKKIARITRDWEKVIYDFYGKMERGQEMMIKQNAAFGSALYMSMPFNTFLTNQYIKKYKNLETIEYVKVLANDLKIVFSRILKRNNWLSPKTKNIALEKLDKMKFVIGNVSELREDPLLDYNNNLYENLDKIVSWRHKEFLKLEGKHIIDIPMLDWTQYPVKLGGTQAYIVNAQYTPSKNEIFINLGYIQPPFIDLNERGIEYNLANIGLTIAHEMSHGFDDMGSKYDLNGKLFDWWTPEDKKKFAAIQKDIIKQYEDWAKKDGIVFDASISIGEDMADISGIAICDEYLRNFQKINNFLIPIRYSSFQIFYTYYAFQMKQKIAKKALMAQLKTNPHPLDKYRTNVPLSRSSIFRAVYNIKKDDGMWWHNTNTVW